ncbi:MULTISPECIES: VOC family protein [Bacillaceae]|uniref:VOC family protein n=1 Tax=Evansella alkalicola TaxID=745819 RepID=A0ABS6JYQ6_9BACI|nr:MULTISPECIES: VOC family protein [Bacillaceae]MBU9723728.1 VOC family protein [Bacillus alkalicola]
MESKFFSKPTVYVGEVSINVINIEKSLQFYNEFLGLSVLEKGGRKAVLTADGTNPLLTLHQPEDVTGKKARTTGLFHFAILLPTRSDLSAFLNHLVQTGVQLGASDHLVSEALYISDPDGNGIEIYHDRLASEWDWVNGEVVMATEPLDGQGLLAESNESWNGFPPETVMGHIHLHVSSLEGSQEFYTKGLGFDIATSKYPGALFLSTGGYHHHIGLNVWNGEGASAPAKNSVGFVSYTLVYPNQEVRDKVVSNLTNIGVSVDKKDYRTEDPSGNEIVLVVGE